MYEIHYRRSVKSDLKSLPRDVRIAVVGQILSLKNNPRPRGHTKISGFENTFRIRKGVYRIVYSVDKNKLIVIIIRVGHRKDVYKKL